MKKKYIYFVFITHFIYFTQKNTQKKNSKKLFSLGLCDWRRHQVLCICLSTWILLDEASRRAANPYVFRVFRM